MKTNIIVVILLTLALQVCIAEDDGLQALMTKFSALSERKADFIEERHAYYLDSPLKSQGHLTAIPPDRLEKFIVSPEQMTQIISGDRLIHSRNGKTEKAISLSQQPVLAVTINALRAVLFGDVAFLNKRFETYYEAVEKKWQLKLLPRERKINKYIKSIMVAGEDDRVVEFLIAEANGDYTITRLYEHQQ